MDTENVVYEQMIASGVEVQLIEHTDRGLMIVLSHVRDDGSGFSTAVLVPFHHLGTLGNVILKVHRRNY